MLSRSPKHTAELLAENEKLKLTYTHIKRGLDCVYDSAIEFLSLGDVYNSPREHCACARSPLRNQ